MTVPGVETARALPARARVLFLGIAFSALGSGMSMPYLFVYLTKVRHLPPTDVGLVLSWMGVVGLACTPLIGTVIDRFGPRPVLVVGLVGEAGAMALVATVHTLLVAWLVATLAAVFTGVTWPASSALLARMVAPAARERAYGVQFMLMNAGFGVGGLVSSALVELSRPATFELLYLVDAASYLGYIVVLLALPRGAGAAPAADRPADEPAGPKPGWREVLADRTLLAVVGIAVVLMICGYSQVEAGFTAFSVGTARVSPNVLGWAFAMNTAIIVVGQLLTLRWVRGRRRTLMLGTAGLLWAASWCVIAAAGLVPGGVAAICLVVGGFGAFGIAETIWAPVLPAMVNGLAPERLRGRYNAMAGLTWSVSGIIGPALSGVLLGSAGAGWWVLLCVGGSALGGVGFLLLRRRVSAARDGLPAPAEPAAEPAVAAAGRAGTDVAAGSAA